jgi:hypothetical protein
MKKEGGNKLSYILLGIFLLVVAIFVILDYLERVPREFLDDGLNKVEIEGGYVIYYWRQPFSVDEVVEDFTELYLNYQEIEKEVYLLYKDVRGVYLMGYGIDQAGYLNFGELKKPVDKRLVYREILEEKDGKVRLKINGKIYNIPLE